MDRTRRILSIVLLIALAVSGAAPASGSRLVCPMPMDAADASPACGGCDASPGVPAAASLAAASCCTVTPVAESEAAVPAIAGSRRGHSGWDPTLRGPAPTPAVFLPSPVWALSAGHVVPAPTIAPPLSSTRSTVLRN